MVGKGNQSKYLKIAADRWVGEEVDFPGVQTEGIEGCQNLRKDIVRRPRRQ